MCTCRLPAFLPHLTILSTYLCLPRYTFNYLTTIAPSPLVTNVWLISYNTFMKHLQQQLFRLWPWLHLRVCCWQYFHWPNLPLYFLLLLWFLIILWNQATVSAIDYFVLTNQFFFPYKLRCSKWIKVERCGNPCCPEESQFLRIWEIRGDVLGLTPARLFWSFFCYQVIEGYLLQGHGISLFLVIFITIIIKIIIIFITKIILFSFKINLNLIL